MSKDRRLPQNIEAEQALLGAILVNNSALLKVSSFLKPEHFSEPLHAEIFRLASNMIADGKKANPITLKTFLQDAQVGSLTIGQYLARLCAEAATVINAVDFGQAVHDTWKRRQMIVIADELKTLAFDMPYEVNPDEAGVEVQAKLHALRDIKPTVTLSEAAESVIDATAKAKETGTVPGVPWAFDALRNLLGGSMRYGNFYGLLMDSGGGKTSFSLQQMRYSAESGIPVLFFSYEQNAEQCVAQMISQRARIPLKAMQEGTLSDKQFFEMDEQRESLADLEKRFHIITASGMPAPTIRARMKEFGSIYGKGLCIIDHAKSISPGKRTSGLAEETNEIYSQIRDGAKESGLATIILVQRLRKALERPNPAPTLMDAYGGGGVYEPMDAFVGMYRPAQAHKTKADMAETDLKRMEFENKAEAEERDAWVYCLKNRYGAIGQRRKLLWTAEFTRFDDVASYGGFDQYRGGML